MISLNDKADAETCLRGIRKKTRPAGQLAGVLTAALKSESGLAALPPAVFLRGPPQGKQALPVSWMWSKPLQTWAEATTPGIIKVFNNFPRPLPHQGPGRPPVPPPPSLCLFIRGEGPWGGGRAVVGGGGSDFPHRVHSHNRHVHNFHVLESSLQE